MCNLFEDGSWEEWSSWTECSLQCGSSASIASSRSRSRVCTYDSSTVGEQDVQCSGDSIEADTVSCEGRETTLCPDKHCPPGFHISAKYEDIYIYIYIYIYI